MDSGVFATVIGSILGFAASVVPDILAVWRRRTEGPSFTPPGFNGAVTDGSTIDVGSDAGVGNESAAVETRIPYVMLDFLRASVRPVLTYAFFVVFAYIKLLVLYHAMYVDGAKGIELLPLIWDEGTEALFAAVVAFWFGSRAISRRR